MKYGKAIGKVILPISDKAMAHVEQEMKKIGDTYNMWVIVKPWVSDYMKYAEGGFNLTVYFCPKSYSEGVIRNPRTKSRLKLLDIPNDAPSVFVDLTYNDSVIEGTDEHVNQYHYYIRTHGFMETQYRCRTIGVFSDYVSFDYDTDIEVITKTICENVKQILEVYKPLICGKN